MVEIENKLYSEIKEYCKLNGLIIKDFINKLLKKAFTVEKYGDKPFSIESVPQKKRSSKLEQEAVDKIKDIIENQVSVPPEIMEAVDEHFFEMLVDSSNNEIKPVLPMDYETPKVVMVTSEPKGEYYSEITMDAVNEAVKKIQKHTEKKSKKRKL
jgi:hypothetical protein